MIYDIWYIIYNIFYTIYYIFYILYYIFCDCPIVCNSKHKSRHKKSTVENTQIHTYPAQGSAFCFLVWTLWPQFCVTWQAQTAEPDENGICHACKQPQFLKMGANQRGTYFSPLPTSLGKCLSKPISGPKNLHTAVRLEKPSGHPQM